MIEHYNHKSLSNIVVDYIRNKILLSEYKEGDHVLESEVASALGISRAPVREGIKELVSQGLIKTIPRKGNYVVKLNQDDLQEIFDIRLLLESSVIETLINKKLLKDSDFEVLNKYIEGMITISHEDAPENDRINRINEKDTEFHQYLWLKSGSQRKFKILSDLYSQLRMAMIIDTRQTGNLDRTAKDHLNIVKTLKQGDIKGCKKALRDHIEFYVSREQDNN
ncbi:MAG: GntR family transcriptional regulator [Bacillota bacterium]